MSSSRKRRSFTAEYRVEAAHRVIDSGRTIAEVTRELGLHEGLLAKWVKDERRRIDAAAVHGEQPLSPAERAELLLLRKRVIEQDKDIAFLKKVCHEHGRLREVGQAEDRGAVRIMKGLWPFGAPSVRCGNHQHRRRPALHGGATRDKWGISVSVSGEVQ
ncbi:transposase [Nocardia sp. NPDC049220]|uniref:transposase n=1 Tax=Nocardia sp. NPDC049220 TaxID=3155273 RepID=UPI0033E3341C